MSTDAIKQFLREAYTDEKLAALKAHTEDGKLSYKSCCCFIGCATRNGALYTENQYGLSINNHDSEHYFEAVKLSCGVIAELEYCHLGDSDAERREHLLPLINEEIARRDSLKAESSDTEGVGYCVTEEIEDCA
jgi:hypothetical protein